VLAVACAEEPPPSLPRGAPVAAPQRWAGLAEAEQWPAMGTSFVSRGHGAGEYVVTVRVPESYAALYRGLVTGAQLPAGMTVAAFHEHRGERASVYVMTKEASDDWAYLVVRPDGVLEPAGAVALCARCHAEAPVDSLFGSPRGPGESAASDTR
jgi:hypothetical protein